MSTYLLFGGCCFYPSGGFEDYMGTYETLEDAVMAAKEGEAKLPYSDTWYHVVRYEYEATEIVWARSRGEDRDLKAEDE